MRTETIHCDNCAAELELGGDDTELEHGWFIVVAPDESAEENGYEYQFCGPICVGAWVSERVFV